VSRTIVMLALFGLSGVVCFAQSKKPVTVTSCLAQGDGTNEYSIKDSSEKTYGLMSSKIDMKAHLGHEVTVTGAAAGQNERRAPRPTKTKRTALAKRKRASTCR